MAYLLKRNSNQILGLVDFAYEFYHHGTPTLEMIRRTKLLNADSFMSGLAAFSLNMTSTKLFANETKFFMAKPMNRYRYKAPLLGGSDLFDDVKAFATNACASGELGVSPSILAFDPKGKQFLRGTSVQSDYYGVVLGSSAHRKSIDGMDAIKAMIALDEIHGRLAEAVSAEDLGIDPSVLGAIASAIIYSVLHDISFAQTDMGISMFLQNLLPLDNSNQTKQIGMNRSMTSGLALESAIACVKRTMIGMEAPRDFLRNPDSIFGRLLSADKNESPFDLDLSFGGTKCVSMNSHFTLGCYDINIAGTIHGLVDLIFKNQFICHNDINCFEEIEVSTFDLAYQTSKAIDPSQLQDIRTAMKSIPFVLASILNRAISDPELMQGVSNFDDMWRKLMLGPSDFMGTSSINSRTLQLMKKIKVIHGGSEFDEAFPDGLPARVKIQLKDQQLDSHFIKYPAGHSKNKNVDLEKLLTRKFIKLAEKSIKDSTLADTLSKLKRLDFLANAELQNLNNVDYRSVENPWLFLESTVPTRVKKYSRSTSKSKKSN